MRLMQRMEAVAARRRLSPRPLAIYQAWVRQFLRFHRDAAGAWRHPAELRGDDVAAFLTHLAHARKLSASSQNQAMKMVRLGRRRALGETDRSAMAPASNPLLTCSNDRPILW